MKNRIALMLVAFIASAAAGESPRITVNASGTAKLIPTGLQVWVTLKEKAPDAAAAMLALKASQEKVTVKLAALGLKNDPLKSEPPSVVDKAAQNAMRQQRSGQRLKRKAAVDEKVEVEMQQMVRVVVPFTAKDLEGVVVEAEMLKAKIKAANLIEEKTAGAADGDEDENGGNPYGNQAASAINFMYFAPHNDDVQSRALAEALKKASDVAARTAKAMGKAGVELFAVTVVADSAEASMRQFYQYSRYGNGQAMEMPSQEDGMTSQTPQMTVGTQVSAEFHFK